MTASLPFFVPGQAAAPYHLQIGAAPGTLEGSDGTIHPIRQTFQSAYSEYRERIGQPFTIQSMAWHDGDRNPEPTFRVRFEDGAEIPAHAEEVLGGWATNWHGQDGL